MGKRTQGAICTTNLGPGRIDKGTSCLTRSTPPGQNFTKSRQPKIGNGN